MGTRIHAQIIYTQDHPGFSPEGYARINRGLARVYEKVLHPDTLVVPRFVERSTFYTSHAHLELLNNGELVRGIIEGEAQGADVAFVRCGNDPAIREAREAVRIPVVGMSEAAMHLACQLGSRFALIGVDAKSGPLVERNLRAYGLESRAIARRPYRLPDDPSWDGCLNEAPRWFDSPDYVRERVIPAFEKTARACIEEGAEVILTACALYGCLTLVGYHKISGTEVPVIEGVAVGIKTAELLGDLKRTIGLSTSKHLTYQSLVDAPMRAMLTGSFWGEPPTAVSREKSVA